MRSACDMLYKKKKKKKSESIRALVLCSLPLLMTHPLHMTIADIKTNKGLLDFHECTTQFVPFGNGSFGRASNQGETINTHINHQTPVNAIASSRLKEVSFIPREIPIQTP